MGDLQAAFARNKKTIAIAGAGLVVVLALVARKRGTTATSTSPAVTSYGTGLLGSTASSSTPYSTYTPYDSTGSDITGALQQNTEALQQLLSSTPVPQTTATPTPTPTVQGYFRRTGTQAVYQANSDGTLQWLDAAAYAGAGKPQFTDVAASDPLWNRPVVGTNAPANTR